MTSSSQLQFLRQSALAIEATFIFLVLPTFFYFHATHWNIHIALWCIATYALVVLSQSPTFSWQRFWVGIPWDTKQKCRAIFQFCACAPLLLGLCLYLHPENLFRFPIERPLFWMVVMILYPVLSVVPQEIIFRSFFFHRYRSLFRHTWLTSIASAILFGFMHVVFHNGISPVLSALGGSLFGYSYAQHQSLKWASLEHAAYGCAIFTIGLGSYFLVGGALPG